MSSASFPNSGRGYNYSDLIRGRRADKKRASFLFDILIAILAMKNTGYLIVCLLAFAIGASYCKSYTSGRKGRIVGGSVASLADYPYNVIVFDSSFGYDTPICYGAIYSESWIITAGSCVIRDEVSFLKVSAGNQDLLEYEGTEQSITVDSYVLHEGFDSFTLRNDIVLLHLSEPLQFNENVSSISLPAAAVDAGDFDLTGWSNNTFSAATVSSVLDEDCSAFYPELTDASSMMCVQGDGVYFCPGEEGAPLRDDSSNLVGIASWTYACNGIEGSPLVFTEIVYFVDWIVANAA